MPTGHLVRHACRSFARGTWDALLPLVVSLVVALVALGPSVGPFARALGALDEHACACGMKPGTCGCPECARRLLGGDPLPETVATLGSCDDHGKGSLATPLALGVLPPGLCIAASPRGASLPRFALVSWVVSRGAAPPVPPPRFLAV